MPYFVCMFVYARTRTLMCVVSWEMQIIQMEQLVLMKSKMRTQVVMTVHINKNKYGIFVKNTWFLNLNENALLSLSAKKKKKTAQSRTTKQSL